jgi:hypothetical protein
MFTKDIRGVHRSRDVVETQHAASNGLSHSGKKGHCAACLV